MPHHRYLLKALWTGGQAGGQLWILNNSTVKREIGDTVPVINFCILRNPLCGPQRLTVGRDERGLGQLLAALAEL